MPGTTPSGAHQAKPELSTCASPHSWGWVKVIASGTSQTSGNHRPPVMKCPLSLLLTLSAAPHPYSVFLWDGVTARDVMTLQRGKCAELHISVRRLLAVYPERAKSSSAPVVVEGTTQETGTQVERRSMGHEHRRDWKWSREWDWRGGWASGPWWTCGSELGKWR